MQVLPKPQPWQVGTAGHGHGHGHGGALVPSEPGYEEVEVGPTTNFVGNAMTRGAVDLVMVRSHP